MHSIVGITGTPGTGKKSVAPLVARSLDSACMGLNDLARARGLKAGKGGELEVDADALGKEVRRSIRGRAVVYGHLLPYVLTRGMVSRVAVLRCEPAVLKERLRRRRYGPRKVEENVEAELIGLIAADAFVAFGSRKTFEVDTTYSSPREAADLVVRNAFRAPMASERIDWTVNYDSGARLRSLLSS